MKKPKLTPNSRFKQGYFAPTNPHKYVGKVDELVYRSGLELRYMKYFDEKPFIISWASEEMTVSYVSPIDKKVHQYFPDFLVKVKTSAETVETWMIEIKPSKEVEKPSKGSKTNRRFITEVVTYEINQAKWKYAEAFCERKNWKFKVLTEKEIKIK